MYIGAAYYPELWKEQEIDKDIKKCKALGINCLRVGEFAWGKMEPSEGNYDFSWLENVVKKLENAGIYVVMCTPSCTPPRWLLDKYPEVMQVTDMGERQKVSSRCHVCKTSELMRKHNRQIVTKMAEKFNNSPAIIGWQIDNELFNYGGGCYCDICVAAFREYLRKKYGDIQALNRAWGMSRWSLDYPSFEHIQPPHAREWRHPSLRTEWKAFQCRQIYSYAAEQAEILHKYTSVPIGTDMMPFNSLSYYEMNESLDVVQFNHYDKWYNLPLNMFDYDFIRPIKQQPFWVTETQVGWNGSEVADNGYRPAGNCYANTWLPIAKGGQMNMYWLFRAPKNGHELAHGALLSTAGRPYKVSEEVARASHDILKCEKFLSESRVKSKLAIHYSAVAERNFGSAPLLKDFVYRNGVRKVYNAFAHCNVDVIDTQHEISEYSTIISPFLSTIDDSTRERLLNWVKSGGVWIVGPMSDIMSDYTAKCEEAPYFSLEDIASVYTKYQNPVHNEVYRAKWSDGKPLGISLCYDAYECLQSSSLATYDGDDFDGYSVLTERQLGDGKIILVGSMLDADGWRRLAGTEPIFKASENICLVEREGEQCGVIVLEIENREGEVELDGEYTDIISGNKYQGRVSISPYKVLVLQK